LAARTVGHAHRVLHCALANACSLETINRNPAAAVKPPKVSADEVEILTQTQIAQVLKTLEGVPLYSLVVLAIATGMRRGELLGLQWCDIDLDGSCVRVERSIEQTRTGLRFKHPKTKAGRRTISLPATAVAVLRKHRQARLEFQMKIGAGRLPDDALVFCDADGAPCSPLGVTQAWARLVKVHDLPKVTLHSLRHTHASALINGGMDIVSVSRRLGHGNPTITLSTYSHVFNEKKDGGAAEIIDTVLAI
jgi:integrase